MESSMALSYVQASVSKKSSPNCLTDRLQALPQYAKLIESQKQQLIVLCTTHEALGVFAGAAKLRFGNSDNETEGGLELDVQAGDVLIIPAGVMHRAVTDKDGFCMVGAYPQNSSPWDMNYGRSEEECKDKQKTIQALPDPAKDPFTGKDIWKQETSEQI